MNVRLAAETYSASVVNSMKLLWMKKHPKFVNSEPTRFTDYIDEAFHILNSFNTRHSNPFKCAINSNNRYEVFKLNDNAFHISNH